MIDRADMALRGRIGGYSKAARYPSDVLTGASRRGFMHRFEPTEAGLTEEERRRRTKCALQAHMAKLARKSALARRNK